MSGRRFFDVTVMRLIAASVLLLLPLGAQPNSQLSVTGDADVQVVLDRVRLSVGVESRDKLLPQARAHDDAAVKSVLAALRGMGIASGDIQTDFIRVDMRYVGGDGAAVDYYTVEKTIAVTLREVPRFEDVLNGTLDAGANHVCDVEFMTSELRKYRDQARAMAAKAALEKAVTWQQPPVCVWTRSRQASLPTHMEAGHGTVAFVTVASKHRTCIRTCIREAVRVTPTELSRWARSA
jgi:uncharacterized protein YggE